MLGLIAYGNFPYCIPNCIKQFHFEWKQNY